MARSTSGGDRASVLGATSRIGMPQPKSESAKTRASRWLRKGRGHDRSDHPTGSDCCREGTDGAAAAVEKLEGGHHDQQR
jgi:hypothetical protein